MDDIVRIEGMIERVLIVHVQRVLRTVQREKVPANLPHVSSQLGVTYHHTKY